MAPPGAHRRTGQIRAERAGRNRHGVGQVGRLRYARPHGSAQRARGGGPPRTHRALPQPDEGPCPRPARGAGRPGAPRAAGGGCRWGHPGRAAGMGPHPCPLDRDQPGHAPPRDPAPARVVAGVPAQPAVRHRRRGAHLPWCVRVARGPRAAQVASSGRAARGGPDVHRRVGDRGRSRPHSRPTARRRGRGRRHRRQRARSRGHRAVEPLRAGCVPGTFGRGGHGGDHRLDSHGPTLEPRHRGHGCRWNARTPGPVRGHRPAQRPRPAGPGFPRDPGRGRRPDGPARGPGHLDAGVRPVSTRRGDPGRDRAGAVR